MPLDLEATERAHDAMLARLSEKLSEHEANARDRVRQVLDRWFDPESGLLPQRLNRLVSADGELSSVLEETLHGEDSMLVRRLHEILGQDNPLLGQLDPSRKDNLLDRLGGKLEASLAEQRRTVLREFSLDEESSALRRMIDEIERRHGKLEQALKTEVDGLLSELSLDVEGSALSRLVRRVEESQSLIRGQLSLDDDTSALARMQREMNETRRAIRSQLTFDDPTSPLSALRAELKAHAEAQTEALSRMNAEMGERLAELAERKAAQRRGVERGHRFEDELMQLLAGIACRAGDLFQATGDQVGALPRCKTGDAVIELGGDSAAPGVRIVVEAKARNQFRIKEAREEMERARKNREAQLGLLVLTRENAVGVETMARFDRDLIVVWDPEDSSTDPFVEAAVLALRALAFRIHRTDGGLEEGLADLDEAIRQLGARASELREINRLARSAALAIEKIERQAEKVSSGLEGVLDALRRAEGHVRGSSHAA